MYKVFITGGAGYVGAMLCREFSKRSDVSAILTVDMRPETDLTQGNKKISFIEANLSNGSWQEKVKEFAPDIIVHTAWQIREMYGEKAKQWKWNVDGSDAVFDVAFSLPSVKRLVHFSTVASYAAYPNNEIEHLFTEAEGFRKTDYLYAEEKRISEEHLKERYENAKKVGRVPQVLIVRPAAITGPRGRYSRIRFGLQSALSGQLKGNFIYNLVSLLVSFTPITKKWCRQYIHEDDVADIVSLLSFSELNGEYEAFNICPPGPVVRGEDMAEAVGKRPIRVHPQFIRFVFFWMWHLTRGKIPTSKGGWVLWRMNYLK
jgi:nucleoside-diphosphate-sugar epimerase